MNMFDFLVSMFELNIYKQHWLRYAIDSYILNGAESGLGKKLLEELKAYDTDTAAAFEFYLNQS